MKHFYDSFIILFIYTSPHNDEYSMSFSSDWRFAEMVDFMVDKFEIDRDSISEIRHTYVKRYKVQKDA